MECRLQFPGLRCLRLWCRSSCFGDNLQWSQVFTEVWLYLTGRPELLDSRVSFGKLLNLLPPSQPVYLERLQFKWYPRFDLFSQPLQRHSRHRVRLCFNIPFKADQFYLANSCVCHVLSGTKMQPDSKVENRWLMKVVTVFTFTCILGWHYSRLGYERKVRLSHQGKGLILLQLHALSMPCF